MEVAVALAILMGSSEALVAFSTALTASLWVIHAPNIRTIPSMFASIRTFPIRRSRPDQVSVWADNVTNPVRDCSQGTLVCVADGSRGTFGDVLELLKPCLQFLLDLNPRIAKCRCRFPAAQLRTPLVWLIGR